MGRAIMNMDNQLITSISLVKVKYVDWVGRDRAKVMGGARV